MRPSMKRAGSTPGTRAASLRGDLVVGGAARQPLHLGENIQPETMEQRLVDHPAVAQALVVPVPSDEWGHRPAAFIDWHDEPAPLPNWPPGSGCRYPASWCRTSGIPWPDLGGNLKPSRTLLARSLRQEVTPPHMGQSPCYQHSPFGAVFVLFAPECIIPLRHLAN